jgi:predicted TIM-barrel fold metal-dependent hydrolase
VLPFEDIPLVDDHLHPPFRSAVEQPYARFFSEAGDSGSVTRHAPHSLFYRWAVSEMAGLLQCEPQPQAVVAAREAIGEAGLLRLLVQDANVEALLIDDGYPATGALSIEEITGHTQCSTRRILRIESLAESLFAEASGPADLADRMQQALEAMPEPAALKTIIAYRCGLLVVEPAAGEVEQAFSGVRAASAGERPRLASKPLLNFLLLRVLDWAVERRLPVQFHTGYGDRDLDLMLANPALLRPLLEQPRFEQLRIVLLHAAYPYSREASYLAAVYPNVYVDWSEVNPMLPERQLSRVLEELLALAPYTKLLYGSDAWGIPDWIWLGARAGRRALALALEDVPGSEQIARRVLRDNARDLYSIGP